MDERNRIDATKKSFAILQEVSDGDGMTLDALEESLEYARSTIHAHLMTLHDIGAVTKRDATYHVGLGILDFGGQAQTRYRSYLVGRDEIDKLATEYETLVQVAFIEDDHCVYVYQAGQQYVNVQKPRLGTKVDFHSSAAGKAIAARLPEERRRELIEGRDLPKYTSNTTTDPEELYAELEEVRSSELAFDFEEQFEGICCVSTPTAFEEDLFGALSVSLPIAEVDRSFLEHELADKVHKCGRLIEMDRQYENWI